MRAVEIEWQPLGITVVAQLSEGPNRNLCDLFWDSLPYNSLQNHALVSGHHLYHLVPSVAFVYTPAESKVDRTTSPDGTLFLSQLQHLAIKYGPLSEYIPAAPVGSVIPEHIPLLREAGRACWDATFRTKQIVEVRVRRKGTAEIVQMHRGVIPSGAGSYSQYFSTLVFLNGETRPLGYCALNGLLRLGKTGNISVEALREMTPTFVRTSAEFLGYCGLDKLWHLTQEMLRVLPQIETRGQFCALVGALALYANVLNTWNLQYFPWRHGLEYPARARLDMEAAAIRGTREVHPVSV